MSAGLWALAGCAGARVATAAKVARATSSAVVARRDWRRGRGASHVNAWGNVGVELRITLGAHCNRPAPRVKEAGALPGWRVAGRTATMNWNSGNDSGSGSGNGHMGGGGMGGGGMGGGGMGGGANGGGGARRRPPPDGGYPNPLDFQFKPPENIGSLVLAGFFLLVVLAATFASIYTVGPDEEAIVLRFGRYVETSQPGAHVKVPLLDEVVKVRTRNVHTEEFGFRTRLAGPSTEYSTQDFPEESLMLTGDLNIADVEWTVQYRISDPKAYLFNMRETDITTLSRTLRDLSESLMRRAVGDRTIDEVLLEGRSAVQEEVQVELQKRLDSYGAGLNIVTVQLRNVTPPDPVKPSFDDVNKAQQDMEKLENEARAEYNRAIPKAEGEGMRRIEMARGYSLERINEAKGDATRFLAVYEEYRKAPAVTRKRLYLEAMGKTLPKAGSVHVISASQKGVLPLLNLTGDGGGARLVTTPAGGAAGGAK